LEVEAMQARWSMPGVGALAILVGCSLNNVRTEFDPDTTFSLLKTYDWAPMEAGTIEDTRADNAVVTSGIRRAVESELAIKGFRLLTTDVPDVYVRYHLMFKDLSFYTSMDQHGAEYDEPQYREMPRIRPYEYIEGTLSLELIDPQTKRRLWRGSYETEVTGGATPEVIHRELAVAVRTIISHYPPKE